MKLAIITDQHFGARKNSKIFHDYFLKFYDEVFFPTLEKENIKLVIDMGDTFDSRKGVDFSTLHWCKKHYYNRLEELGCEVLSIVGNHTAYYKNTNSVNSVDLLLEQYSNIKVFSEPQEYNIESLSVLFLPWINDENRDQSFELIEKSNSQVAMGHLELAGFSPYRGVIMENGLDGKIFKKFKKVFSGHYHTRSDNGKIFYLGNPYEIYWNDIQDARGFHIFDTDTLEHYAIDNPNRMFYNVYYEDTPHQTLNSLEYKDKIVKVIVKKKTNTKNFEKFIDKLYSANVHEVKIVENFNTEENDLEDGYDTEDTLSILNKYVQDTDTDLDKSLMCKLIKQIYQEACEIV